MQKKINEMNLIYDDLEGDFICICLFKAANDQTTTLIEIFLVIFLMERCKYDSIINICQNTVTRTQASTMPVTFFEGVCGCFRPCDHFIQKLSNQEKGEQKIYELNVIVCCKETKKTNQELCYCFVGEGKYILYDDDDIACCERVCVPD